MADEPKYTFSVVIPLYNKEKYIGRTLKSVFSQTVLPYEVIVVNDGSKDNSVKVVESLNYPLIKLIHQTNLGVSAARNRGIEASAGDYVAFLDADDEWDPDFLETICRLISKFPQAGGYATNYRRKFADLTRPARISALNPDPGWEGIIENFFEMLLDEMLITSSSVAIKREVFNLVGMFPEGIAIGEDQDLWCRIAFKYKYAFSSKICATYFKDLSEAATTINRTFEVPFIENYRKHLGSLPISESEQFFLEEYVNKLRIYKAFWAVLNNQKHLSKALLSGSKNTILHKKLWKKINTVHRIPYPIYIILRKIRLIFK